MTNENATPERLSPNQVRLLTAAVMAGAAPELASAAMDKLGRPMFVTSDAIRATLAEMTLDEVKAAGVTVRRGE